MSKNNVEIKYDQKKSLEMLHAFITDDYYKAAKCIEEGADPNFYMFFNDNNNQNKIISFIGEFYSSFWEGGKADRFFSHFEYLSSPEKYILENKKQTMFHIHKDYDDIISKEIQKNESVFDEIIYFLKIWQENGGNLNSPVIKKTHTQNENFHHINHHIDEAYNNIFCSLQDQNNGIDNPEPFERSAKILVALNKVAPFKEKLNTLYQNNHIVGLFAKEAWSISIFQEFLPLINVNKDNISLIDNQGNTPLHYDLQYEKENRLKNSESLLTYSSDYENFITQLPSEFLLMKNNHNLIPLEYIMEKNAYLQFLPLYKLTLQYNNDYIIPVEQFSKFIQNTLKIKNNSKDEKFIDFYHNNFLPSVMEIEKNIINKGICNNKDIPIINKKRI